MKPFMLRSIMMAGLVCLSPAQAAAPTLEPKDAQELLILIQRIQLKPDEIPEYMRLQNLLAVIASQQK